MADETKADPKVEDAPPRSPWMALAPLRWGKNDDGSDRWINPGEDVPAGEAGRAYELMRRTGQIAFRDGALAAPASQPVSFRLHDEYLPRPPSEVAQDGNGAGEPASDSDGGQGGTGAGVEGGGSGPGDGPEPPPIPLSENMTLAELGAIAESMNIPSSGSKAQIIARIEKARVAPLPGAGEGGGGEGK